MENFNNADNQKAAQKSLGFAASACFTLSTLSSAVAIWSGVMAFLDSKFAGASSSLVLSGGAFILVGYFCYIIDFFGISKVGRLFFTEIAAWVSKSFAKYSKLRFVAMFIWAAIFVSFSLVSFATSYYGSDLVKNFAAPKLDVRQLQTISEKRLEADKTIATPFEARRTEVEKARKAELDAVGNKEMRKMAKDGDVWAIKELATAKAAINKKCDAKITAIDKDLRTDKAKFGATQDAIDKAQLSVVNANIEAQQSQVNAVGIVTLLFGVAPLIIGIILIGAMAVTEVSEKEDKAAKKASGGGNSFAGSTKSTRPNTHQRGSSNYQFPN